MKPHKLTITIDTAFAGGDSAEVGRVLHAAVTRVVRRLDGVEDFLSTTLRDGYGIPVGAILMDRSGR